MITISATFDVASWDEHAFDVRAGAAKLTQARVKKKYSGRVEGQSATEWVMAYEAGGSAAFVGMERIDGSIDGRAGTLVLQHVGRFEGGVAAGELRVVSGACTGALSGTEGSGTFKADPAGTIELTLTFA